MMTAARVAILAAGCLCAFAAHAELVNQDGEAGVQEALATSGHAADRQSYPAYAVEPSDDANHLSLQFDSGTLEGLHRFVDFWPSIHWLNAANVATSIASLGYTWRNLKLEGALFKGQETDRRNNEFIRLESTANRLSYKLAPNWALRVSRGYQNSPDQVVQPMIMRRTAASATYFGYIGSNPAMRLDRRHTIFTRLERAGNGELFPEEEAPHQQSYQAQKISLGYMYDIVNRGSTKLAVGASISKRSVPDELVSYYNGNDTSRMVFMRLQVQLFSN
jgi:hypothetical protein